jgi:zinc protease
MASQIPQTAFPSVVPDLGPERPVVWPKRVRQRLANGLDVVLVESHTIPKFNGQLFIRSGNADATPGLADMTATVLRTGTVKRTSRQIEDDLRRWGADLSTAAGADTSAISFSGLVEYAEPILGFVSELTREASLPNEEFERERAQKVEELAIARTTPGFLAGERLRKTLFGTHPYANFEPSVEQVKAYTRDGLVNYYRERYRPGGALFVAVGDFEPAKMMAQIERAFANWTGDALSKTPRPELPKYRGRRVMLVHVPGSVQTQVLLGNLAITRRHPDWLRLALANNIYGGAFHSRLVMNIREQKGYTYSPRSGVSSLREYGFFSIHAAVRNEVTAATLAEMFYELDRMRALPVEAKELEDARSYMSGVFSLGLGTQDGIAGQLANAYLDELPEDYLETFRERVRALTADDVLAAARKYFDSANSQIVIVGDREAVGAQAALYGEVETFDAQGNRI